VQTEITEHMVHPDGVLVNLSCCRSMDTRLGYMSLLLEVHGSE
jgi:hypothetical protein